MPRRLSTFFRWRLRECGRSFAGTRRLSSETKSTFVSRCEPIGNEGLQRAPKLKLIVPEGEQEVLRHRNIAIAKLAKDYSSHLSVTSFELPLFGPCGTEIFWVASPSPRTGGLQRAALASRAPRSTDHCAELHNRFRGLHLS